VVSWIVKLWLRTLIWLGIISMIPLIVEAHVKWFVPLSGVPPARPYQLFDAIVIVWLIVGAIVIGIGILLERKLPSLRKISYPFFEYIDPVIISLFSILIGFSFIIFSISGYIFTPLLVLHTPFERVLQGLQALIGISLMFGVVVQLSSISLFLLYLVVGWYFGFSNFIDMFQIPGIALMLFFAGRPHWAFLDVQKLFALPGPYLAYAVPLLRIFTGINLVILGFHEKILHPELGLAFLKKYPWNFIKMLGFDNFSDYWFVFSTGAVEVLFGIIFILGIITRINAGILTTIFITTLVLLGPVEFTGHLPYFTIIMVLLIFGSGSKLKLFPTTC